MRIDESLPKDIAIKNTSDEPIAFRYYQFNIVQTLAPGEEVVISGASSESTGFYLAQLDDVKGLDIKVTDSDKPQPQPGVTHTVQVQFRDNDTGTVLFCNPTLDDAEGIADAEGNYIWENVEEGIHTLRVDYVGYEVFQDDINVLNDCETSYSLMPKGAVDTYSVRLAFLDENNNPTRCDDVTLDGIQGSIDENLNYNWYNVEEGMHNVYAICDGYQDASFSIEVTYDFSSVYNLVPDEPETPIYNVSFTFHDDNGNVIFPDYFGLFIYEDSESATYSINDATLDGQSYVLDVEEGPYYLRANCVEYESIDNQYIEIVEDTSIDIVMPIIQTTHNIRYIDIDKGASYLSGGNSVIPDDTIADGECITRPTGFELDGYTFEGFYNDAEIDWMDPENIDWNNKFDFENTPIAEDMVIDVVWRKNEDEPRHVTFDTIVSHSFVTGDYSGQRAFEIDGLTITEVPQRHKLEVSGNVSNLVTEPSSAFAVNEIRISTVQLMLEGTDIDVEIDIPLTVPIYDEGEVSFVTEVDDSALDECPNLFDATSYSINNAFITLTYDAGEGTFFDGSHIKTVEAELGSTFGDNRPTPDPTQDGASFESWFNEDYDNEAMEVIEPVTLEATWNEDGDEPVEPREVTFDTANTYVVPEGFDAVGQQLFRIDSGLQIEEIPTENQLCITGNLVHLGTYQAYANNPIYISKLNLELLDDMENIVGIVEFPVVVPDAEEQEMPFTIYVDDASIILDSYPNLFNATTYNIASASIEVTFDAGAGTFSNGSSITTVDAVVGSIYGDIVPNPDPTLADASFMDWSSSDGVDTTYEVFKPATFDAEWEFNEEPEEDVTVNFHGKDSNGEDLWSDQVSTTISSGDSVGNTVTREELIENLNENRPVAGFHINGFYTDIEFTNEFDFNEPIAVDTDVYILYKPDINSHTLKIGFNVEDDGVETYTTVDNITISDEEGEEIGAAQYDENTHQYVFSNISNGNYDLVAEKSGYARIDTNILLTRSQEQEVVLEYTLGTTTSFNVEFYDNDIGADESLNVDSISFVDANGNDVDFDMIATEYTTTNDTTGYVYSPRFPVEIGEYTMTVTKYGYTTRTETVNINGWFSMLVPLENDPTAE